MKKIFWILGGIAALVVGVLIYRAGVNKNSNTADTTGLDSWLPGGNLSEQAQQAKDKMRAEDGVNTGRKRTAVFLDFSDN